MKTKNKSKYFLFKLSCPSSHWFHGYPYHQTEIKSAVVIAKSESLARRIHPMWSPYKWNGSQWIGKDISNIDRTDESNWPDPKLLEVTLLGPCVLPEDKITWNQVVCMDWQPRETLFQKDQVGLLLSLIHKEKNRRRKIFEKKNSEDRVPYSLNELIKATSEESENEEE